MLKSLLIALHDTPASLEAKKLALALARKHGAAVHGLAIVDPDIVSPPEPTPVGGDAYKQRKDAALVERAKAAAEELVRRFTNECRIASVRDDAQIIVGEAAAGLMTASALHDVVLLGVDCDFSGEPADLSPLIAGLLRNNPRPLLVSPRQANADGPTLVAYDGSIPAMRALQLFCALGLRTEHEAIVVSVDDDLAKAATMAETGARFLSMHGYKTSTRPSPPDGDVTGALIDTARAAGAAMIVAGAYGHRGWREWLLGTTTERLLTTSPAHLFIHH
jgi:nucleotide-binding universal stress UspA family protein